MDNNYNMNLNNEQQPMGRPAFGQPMGQPTFQQPMGQPVFGQPMEQPAFQQSMGQPVFQQPIEEKAEYSIEQPIEQPHAEFTVRQSVYTPLYQPKQNKGLVAFAIGSILALITAIVIILVLLITGGGKTALYGTWVSDDGIELTLEKNGKGEYTNKGLGEYTSTLDIEWEKNGDELILTWGSGYEYVYEIIEVEDDTLVLENGIVEYYFTKE